MAELDYAIGQRWSNTAETELGIGVITQVDDRTLTLFFPEADELRQYAKASAPLSRLEFHPRDLVETDDGVTYQVLTRQQRDGLFYYEVESESGEVKELGENQVRGSSRMPEPMRRLLQGHFEHYRDFSLRLNCWQLLANYLNHPARGFLGPRVQPIPHQFHIAQTVTRRTSYRIMLADEVGLGKTIEAGLIAHRDLIAGKVQRLLILVPDSLVHQWLVEMRRRFNLPVRVFDSEQCEAICEQQDTDNPFEHEQVVLCSLDFLLAANHWAQKALASHWDLLIVDEAHHLAWTPEQASPAYELVENFSRQASNLLLLTATPEKEGLASHFAQLHLLDPLKYTDLASFEQDQQQFNQVADLVAKLNQQQPLSATETDQVGYFLGRDSATPILQRLASDPTDSESIRQLSAQLLDHKGTGRALFRNTRASISGFPSRQLDPICFPRPEQFDAPDGFIDDEAPITDCLYPELTLKETTWLAIDPRVAWVMDTLKRERGEKFLIICHHKDTACALQVHLQFKGGIECSAFHEDMTLLERDRSAAWFAADEDSAQALVCSEIGSEGRNFQFCHRLIMFDLPPNIDLLEQRIGRLDRIGQQQDIQLHVLYIDQSPQQRLFDWFNQGFDAFRKTRSANTIVFEQMASQLIPLLQDELEMASLIAESQALIETINESFIQSRNQLLALHSKGDGNVQPLIDAVIESDNDPELQGFLDQVFNAFGVEEEQLSENVFLVRPGNAMESQHFPHLPDSGFSATLNRELALSREDLEYLSWDHPMVRGALDMVLTTGKGSSVISLLKNKQIKEGTLLLELLFIVECPAPKQLQLQRFLPTTPIRLLLDQQGRDLSKAVSNANLDKQLKRIKGELISPMLRQIQEPVLQMVDAAKGLAEKQRDALVSASKEQFQAYWTHEKQRIESLANDSEVSQSLTDIDRMQSQGLEALNNQTRCRLDGLRIMVTVG